ncbi:MAG TPA: response regulator [Sedimentisphaerales bacterium]|nr:response regulator [Sedimentisphaerales bacterium]
MGEKKILIVDDEKDVLLMLEKRLKAKGYSVFTAGNGADALVLARSKHPDLIILDVVMADMDGPEVASQLKKNPKTSDIPVMFLTCLYSKAEEAEKGHQLGNDLIFAKPYDSEELVGTIESLL